MTAIDRTAYPRFAWVMSARELAETFTPIDDEVDWARGRTQDEQHLLARLLLVDPVSRRSEFDKLKEVAQAASLTSSRRGRRSCASWMR